MSYKFTNELIHVLLVYEITSVAKYLYYDLYYPQEISISELIQENEF